MLKVYNMQGSSDSSFKETKKVYKTVFYCISEDSFQVSVGLVYLNGPWPRPISSYLS